MTVCIVETDVGPLRVPEDESVLPWLKRHGTWEPHVAATLGRFLKPGSAFVDVGAHVGYFSRLGAILTGQDGLVFAFEPVGSLFDVLRDNVGGHPHVRCFNFAAWDTKTTLTLRLNPANSGDNTFVKATREERDWRTVPVQAVRIEDYIGCVVPDLIKVDVQGAELHALRGMDMLLCKFLPPLVVEYSPEHLERAGVPGEALVKYCRALGYRGVKELGSVMENRERGYWDIVFTEHPE